MGFHELLLALCIIPSSCKPSHQCFVSFSRASYVRSGGCSHCAPLPLDDGLNFEEKQAKYVKLREKAEDYAARVFQCCARCKMAKRHLLRSVQHWDESKRAQAAKLESAATFADNLGDRAAFSNPLSEESVSNHAATLSNSHLCLLCAHDQYK